MKKEYDLIVVGDGLMAHLLLRKYFQYFPEKSVLQISAGPLAPAISEVSTAVVAQRNVQKGLSELGDKLFDAHLSFLEFYKTYEGKGIEKCIHQTRCSKNTEKIKSFKTRYPDFKEEDDFCFVEEEAYLFDPETFLNEMRAELKQFKIDKVADFIFSQSENEIIGRAGSYRAPLIFLGLGPYSAKWQKFIEYPMNLKEVRGSYLSFDFEFERSFSYTIDGLNLIYRKPRKQLIFGNSQFEGSIGDHDFENLSNKYRNFEFDFELPDISEAHYHSGFRSKASKRLPHWGKNSKGIYFATGFWKNGYTLSFLAADQLLKNWISESVN